MDAVCYLGFFWVAIVCRGDAKGETSVFTVFDRTLSVKVCGWLAGIRDMGLHKDLCYAVSNEI